MIRAPICRRTGATSEKEAHDAAAAFADNHPQPPGSPARPIPPAAVPQGKSFHQPPSIYKKAFHLLKLSMLASFDVAHRDASPCARPPPPTESTARPSIRRQSTTEEILIARGFRRQSTTEEMIRCRNFRRQSSQSDDTSR